MVRQKRVILLILAAITACIGWMCATQIADEETIFPAGAQVQTWADFTGSSLSKHDAIKMLATLAHDTDARIILTHTGSDQQTVDLIAWGNSTPEVGTPVPWFSSKRHGIWLSDAALETASLNGSYAFSNMPAATAFSSWLVSEGGERRGTVTAPRHPLLCFDAIQFWGRIRAIVPCNAAYRALLGASMSSISRTYDSCYGWYNTLSGTKRRYAHEHCPRSPRYCRDMHIHDSCFGFHSPLEWNQFAYSDVPAVRSPHDHRLCNCLYHVCIHHASTHQRHRLPLTSLCQDALRQWHFVRLNGDTSYDFFCNRDGSHCPV